MARGQYPVPLAAHIPSMTKLATLGCWSTHGLVMTQLTRCPTIHPSEVLWCPGRTCDPIRCLKVLLHTYRISKNWWQTAYKNNRSIWWVLPSGSKWRVSSACVVEVALRCAWWLTMTDDRIPGWSPTDLRRRIMVNDGMSDYSWSMWVTGFMIVFN